MNKVWCDGVATVTNTDSIHVIGDSGDQLVSIEMANAGFRPGFTDEPGKSDEIEISIALGMGSNDDVLVLGTDAPEDIQLGQSTALIPVAHINLNSAESTGIDADVSMSGVEFVEVAAAGGNDNIGGLGAKGSGPEPISAHLFLLGGPGSDSIVGGPANDTLDGGSGPDALFGMEGHDHLNVVDGVNGNDKAFGGPGFDQFTSDPGDTVVQ